MASNHQQDEQRLALFIDFENIAIGVRDAHYRKFDINLVLERLLEKGKVLVKKAYADWSRYSDYKRAFHEAAIELIEVPQKSVGGKNSADIRLVVDAIAKRDYPIIQGVIMVFSGVYVLVNLLVDLSYTLLDPRIRY